MSSNEKAEEARRVELEESSDQTGDLSAIAHIEENVDMKKLIRKIDWTILPFITRKKPIKTSERDVVEDHR